MREEILRMCGVTHEKDGILYLNNISWNIFRGEILGLLAMDVFGLDELIALLCRNNPIKYGKIYFDGRLINSYAQTQNMVNQVAVIEKEPHLVSGLSVADNVFVLRKKFRKYILKQEILNRQAQRELQNVGLSVSPGMLCEKLTNYERCVVELLKAVLLGAKLIVLREISDILGRSDLKRFQDLVQTYAQQGISFLYVCSHHEEVFPFCHRTALFADGYFVKIFEKEEMIEEKMEPYTIQIGKGAGQVPQEGESVLTFRNVFSTNLSGLNIVAKKGECVTLLDNDNCILKDIVDLMTGQASLSGGEILIENSLYKPKAKGDFLKKGVAVIGENPLHTMLFYERSYLYNLMFLVDRKMGKSILGKNIQRSIEKELALELGDNINNRNIEELSAKDLYSLLYYRILLYHPKVMICVQPFSGADMYLRKHIAGLIEKCKEQGSAVILLAVRLSDTLRVSERLYIIEKGKVQQECSSQEYLQEIERKNQGWRYKKGEEL